MTEIYGDQPWCKQRKIQDSLYARPPHYSSLGHPEVARVPVHGNHPVDEDYVSLRCQLGSEYGVDYALTIFVQLNHSDRYDLISVFH